MKTNFIYIVFSIFFLGSLPAQELNWSNIVPTTSLLLENIWIQYSTDDNENIVFLVITKDQKQPCLIQSVSKDNRITQIVFGEKNYPLPSANQNFFFISKNVLIRRKLELKKRDLQAYLQGYFDGLGTLQ